MTRIADAYVPAPWLPDVAHLDNLAAAKADDVARYVALGYAPDDRARDNARAYVALCDAIDAAWVAYAQASRAAA